MPDHRTATSSDGGYRDRTGDLLLAKARTTVHQGAPNGSDACSSRESAAAAATPNRTPPESLSESLRPSIALPADGTLELARLAADGLIPWDALERYARTLDRSEACHTLRVRHHQAAIAQRHTRAAVSYVRKAVGA